MNTCTEFEEPMSILCQVIIWTVTLTFDGLISKSIGIIYTPETNMCAKFDEPRSILCLVWSIYQYVDSHCDLDL